jgi:hypothetical protein
MCVFVGDGVGQPKNSKRNFQKPMKWRILSPNYWWNNLINPPEGIFSSMLLLDKMGQSFSFSCAGWGYMVAFTKVLKIYQIHHTWIQPLHHSPSSSLSPLSWNSFKSYHFYIYIQVCTVFAPYSPSYPLSHSLLFPPVPITPLTPRQNLFCPPVLWFCRIKQVKKMTFLFV